MAASKKDITDAQVLAQLRTRKLRLQLELERVNIAIRAFENIKDIDPLDAIVFELEDPLSDNFGVDDTLAKSILMYNPKMSMEKKILYVLEEIGNGDAHAITEYLLKVDGHIKDTVKLFNSVTYSASRMYKTGKLNVSKEGKKNVYKLIT
ncbi:MAG: hypothetical protein V4560_16625 [Bacteroidota bacterium]